MRERIKPYWGPTKTLRTPEDVRRAGEVERQLLNPNNVPTIKEAVQSVELGFKHDVVPMFKRGSHFKAPRGR